MFDDDYVRSGQTHFLYLLVDSHTAVGYMLNLWFSDGGILNFPQNLSYFLMGKHFNY